ncbi:MAG: 2-oxoacid:acceptor oxidoreductase family protein [Planctomycetota bacterium]|jgi:2-oxoglutarate ferredoxin oxidoreductase subunit gamma
MVTRSEVKIGGFGGQGVILSGIIIGKAASLYDNKHATLIQAFGPEARGSACSAQVVLADEYIGYPYITRPHYEVIMSQEAYTKFVPELADDGVLMYEKDLVKLENLPPGIKAVGIPATRIAEELGHRIILNIVMVGFFCAVSGLISEEAARQAIQASVPPGTESLNLSAFKRGYEYGKENM